MIAVTSEQRARMIEAAARAIARETFGSERRWTQWRPTAVVAVDAALAAIGARPIGPNADTGL